MSPARPLRVELRRIYDDDAPSGYRVLVDRLWPRGVAKADANLDEWAKDVAPSPELRVWFGHDPARYAEFARRYRRELTRAPAAEVVDRLRALASRRRVLLLTANRDLTRSSAGVLYAHMAKGLARRSS